MAKRKGVSIPKITQLPSGAYNCYLRIKDDNGVTQNISITDDDYKTVEAKAIAIKSGVLKVKTTSRDNLTLREALDKYIDVRRATRSPSTIRGYVTIARTRFQPYMQRRVNTFTPELCRRMISEEAKLCSPKTLKNAWRFVSGAIYEETGNRFDPPLPQDEPKEPAYFTPEQIKVFVDVVEKDKIAIPALLGLCSLRRSELLGLTWDNVDLQKRIIKVSGAAVYDEHNKLVAKSTNKNKTSTRLVPILMPQLFDALSAVENKTGRVVTSNPTTIRRRLQAICAANSLPPVTPHGLRHSFASLAYHLQIPEKVAMQIGGWSNDTTMRKIYTHIAEADVVNQVAKLQGFFSQNADENADA